MAYAPCDEPATKMARIIVQATPLVDGGGAIEREQAWGPMTSAVTWETMPKASGKGTSRPDELSMDHDDEGIAPTTPDTPEVPVATSPSAPRTPADIKLSTTPSAWDVSRLQRQVLEHSQEEKAEPWKQAEAKSLVQLSAEATGMTDAALPSKGKQTKGRKGIAMGIVDWWCVAAGVESGHVSRQTQGICSNLGLITDDSPEEEHDGAVQGEGISSTMCPATAPTCGFVAEAKQRSLVRYLERR